jgi:cholesterol 7alpha-monooxygenase
MCPRSIRPFIHSYIKANKTLGRFIARREVQMYTALMLMRFHMSLVQGESKRAFPKMDNALPSGGIQVPLKGEDLIIRVRPAE